MVQPTNLNMKRSCIKVISLIACAQFVRAFSNSPSCNTFRCTSFTTSYPSFKQRSSKTRAPSSNSLRMFDEGLHIPKRVAVKSFQGDKTNTANIQNDKTNIGNLVVPSVGVGTISWSSKSCKCNKKK